MRSAEKVLKRYGLTAALTPEDDPELWAAVLARHWPDLNGPEVRSYYLRFCVGAPGVGACIRPTETWRFEGEGNGLRALFVEGSVEPSYPLLLLAVERPSAGRKEALVDAGRVVGSLAGSGAATLWWRDEEGWQESGAPVSSWIS